MSQHPDWLQGLATEHPYYCSESNFYSNESHARYENLAEFLDAFEEADEDMNLCFRWDIKLHDEDEPARGYYAQVFLMMQRKGKFYPVWINTVREEDIARFRKYLDRHHAVMQNLWKPL